MTARDDAVKAFIEAICVPCICPPEEPGARWRMVSPDCIACGPPETYVPVGLAAAAPILLTAERARITAAITADANFEPSCAEDIGFYDGLMRAARIAETAPEERT